MKFIKRIIKQLLCPHFNTWTNNPIEDPIRDRMSKAGYMDYRTDERYWVCRNCGKTKNFGYRGIPL